MGDKTSRASISGNFGYLSNPRMVVRWVWGKSGFGRRYDCIEFQLTKKFLEEATRIPAEKCMIDSTFGFEDAKAAFDRLDSGRTRGKVVVEMDV